MKLNGKFNSFSKYQLIQKFKQLAQPKNQANLVADTKADLEKQAEAMAERQQQQRSDKPDFPENK